MSGLLDAQRYSYHVDPSADSTANKVLRLVGEERRVLELGPASGSMTRALVELNRCSVVAVELDEAMAEQARPFCERMIIADLERLDWQATFGEERFDVVIAADVLEHLSDPWSCLQAMRELLRPEGFIVLSIPNIAHAAVLGELLRGRFPYQEKGLLDRTHLRFFTRFDLEDMLLATGFLPVIWDRNRVAATESEFAANWQALPEELQVRLAAQADADTYQFIVKAYPSNEAGWVVSTREAMVRGEAIRERLSSELLSTRERVDEYRTAYEESSRVAEDYRRYADEQRQAYETVSVQMVGWQDTSEQLSTAVSELTRERDEYRRAYDEYREAYDNNGRMLQDTQASHAELLARCNRLASSLPLRVLNRLRRLLGKQPWLQG